MKPRIAIEALAKEHCPVGLYYDLLDTLSEIETAELIQAISKCYGKSGENIICMAKCMS